MPLSPKLYDLLQRRFGEVRIVHEGEEFIATYSPPDERGFCRSRIIQRGETYKINCPFCSDTRFRLWVNHTWGQWNPKSGTYNYNLVHCFNDDCLKDWYRIKALHNMVFSLITRQIERKTKTIRIAAPVSPELPGKVTPLHELPSSHHANAYLIERGFDPEALSRNLQVGYCEHADQKYAAAANRIIIPIQMNNELAGWQARYIGERAWKQCKLNKYYSMPGMARLRLLYNYDVAKNWPYVVIVEGPSDVWSVGRQSVATLGKSVSRQQLEIIADTWRHGCVIVALDPDATAESAEYADYLKPKVRSVITVELGSDPGSTSTQEVWSSVESNLEKAGIDVNDYKIR